MGNDDSASTHEFWFCPLYSFHCHSDEDYSSPLESINISETIQIQRVTLQLREYLELRYPDWEEASISDFIIVMPCTYNMARYGKAYFLKEVNEKIELLITLVTAFRLCHKGGITPGPLISSKESVFGTFSSYISKTEIDFVSFGLPEYLFQLSDISLVNKLFTQICNYHKREKYSALNEALRRFNSSYSGEPEDRLIDQMIAFESLYLGYDQELKYRLAMRVAFLLGEGRGKDRKCIFRDVKNAYDYRSDIVHGNKQVNISKLEEIIPKTEEYLRQTIKRYFSLFAKGYSLERIRQGTKENNALLDENILNNGKTLALKE